MSKTSYRHLSLEEKWQIKALNTSGYSARKIAAQLGRSPTTIADELKRGCRTEEGGYSPRLSEKLYVSSRRRSGVSRRKLNGVLWKHVRNCLLQRWSPEQISGRLELEGAANISHSTIYRGIYQRQDARILECLRHKGKRYKKHGNAGRSLIPNRVDITERPAIVDNKQRIGDWEADTVLSSRESKAALVTLVDRASKYTCISKVEQKTAEAVNNAILKELKPHKTKVRTITYDNGVEFAHHQQINNILLSKSYFAKPYHSWERGLNEHTNGLIRQFFPKKTNFKYITNMEIKEVQNLLNNRPRKVLNYLTPTEAFFKSYPSSLIQ